MEFRKALELDPSDATLHQWFAKMSLSGRTQEAIESALKQLRIDGVIGPFTPLVGNSSRGREAQERIEQHAYHWWDDYQRQLWLFESPPYLKELYRSRPRKADVPD